MDIFENTLHYKSREKIDLSTLDFVQTTYIYVPITSLFYYKPKPVTYTNQQSFYKFHKYEENRYGKRPIAQT